MINILQYDCMILTIIYLRIVVKFWPNIYILRTDWQSSLRQGQFCVEKKRILIHPLFPLRDFRWIRNENYITRLSVRSIVWINKTNIPWHFCDDIANEVYFDRKNFRRDVVVIDIGLGAVTVNPETWSLLFLFDCVSWTAGHGHADESQAHRDSRI